MTRTTRMLPMRAVKPLVTRNQLALGGGGLVLAVVIMIAATRAAAAHKPSTATSDAGSAQGSRCLR